MVTASAALLTTMRLITQHIQIAIRMSLYLYNQLSATSVQLDTIVLEAVVLQLNVQWVPSALVLERNQVRIAHHALQDTHVHQRVCQVLVRCVLLVHSVVLVLLPLGRSALADIVAHLVLSLLSHVLRVLTKTRMVNRLVRRARLRTSVAMRQLVHQSAPLAFIVPPVLRQTSRILAHKAHTVIARNFLLPVNVLFATVADIALALV